MDSSQMNTPMEKKSVLENLDRDELIQKCKGLLGIAQKAKKAKDELAKEVTVLKEKLIECDTQKQADKDCLKTMQMMVDALTQNKLEAANKVADLEKSIINLNQQLNVCNDKLVNYAELEIENEAKNKQIQRLTHENEEQEMDLRKLDEKLAKVSELSQRQTQELLVLEQSMDKWKEMETAYHKLQHENKELLSKFETVQSTLNNETVLVSKHDDIVTTLQTEYAENRRLYEENLAILNQELDNLRQSQMGDNEKIDVLKEQLQHENGQLKKKCDELAHKLDKYKGKVCEFSSKLKEVKQSKKLLGETVLEYSKLVTKWHIQIAHASKLLVKEVNGLNDAKAELEKQVKIGESKVQELRKTIDDLELKLEDAVKNNESDEIKEKYELLLSEYKSLHKDIEDKKSEISSLSGDWKQICAALKEENEKRGAEIEKLTKECENKSKQISELEEKEAAAASQRNDLSTESSQTNRLNDMVEELKQTIDELESRLAEATNTDETNAVEEKYLKLLTEYKSTQAEIENKNSEIVKMALESKQSCASLNEQIKNYATETEKLREECQAKSTQLSELIQKEIAAEKANAELVAETDSLNKQIRILTITISELESRLERASKDCVSDKYEKLKMDYSSLQLEIERKNAELSNLAKMLEEFRSSLKEQSEQHSTEMKKLNEENQEKLKKLNELEEKEIVLIKKNHELLSETSELNEKLCDLKNKISEMESQLEVSTDHSSLQMEIDRKNVELTNLAHELEELRSSLKQRSEQQSAEFEKLSKEAQTKSQQLLELEKREALANKKHDELLAEMRELNDVLKRRGEVISNQTAEIDRLNAKIEEQSKQIVSLEEEIKEKTKNFDQMRNQIDNQNEILSTSTISRADEVARMRDIEDSFEEKYNKLRTLAFKLKKKIAEQQATITKLEAAKSTNTEPSNITPVSLVPVPTQAQNLISLQKDNDRLLDKIDAMKSEQKQFKAEINQLNEQIKKAEEEAKTLRIVNDDIKVTLDTNLKIKSALDEQIRADEKHIQTLKNENEKLMQQLKNAENEIVKVKDVVKQKENAITQKSEEVAKIRAEINKLKATMKKSSVLNLEVEAYEKSLTEMSQKCELNLKQLNDAKREIETHQCTIKKLNTEIQTLINQLDLEKQTSNEYQQQVELQRIKLKENTSEIIELKRIIDDHVKEKNHIKIELTNLQSQYSENEVEKQRLISKLNTVNENNVTKIVLLEEEVRDLRTKLSSCEQELANVQTDFASYKIKAQTVLRQNQLRDSSHEEELKEQLAILTQTKDDLNAKLAYASEQQRRMENTIEELKGEKTNLQDRCKKLLQLLDETRQQIDTMQTEFRKQTQDHHEALKTHRLQMDTLNNCFKNQIKEMQQKHEEEISALKSSIITNATMKSQKDTEVIDTTLSLAKGAQMTTDQRIELLMSERQDGEGSECTSSTNQRKIFNARNKHELIPLDELLNNTLDEELETTESNEEKLVSIEKFEAQQSRVKHLSTLLSEAEMDVTRLSEMNAMLKEELRRQERSTEREKEMKNLEYMKNVIFKFLTINNADERAHLVPVLNIMLKLSPDESKTLQTAARGSDGGQSGWSNLLPMW